MHQAELLVLISVERVLDDEQGKSYHGHHDRKEKTKLKAMLNMDFNARLRRRKRRCKSRCGHACRVRRVGLDDPLSLTQKMQVPRE